MDMYTVRREKVQALEAKLRGVTQDKANVSMEKAALERELKALRSQAGKLTKVGDGLRRRAVQALLRLCS